MENIYGVPAPSSTVSANPAAAEIPPMAPPIFEILLNHAKLGDTLFVMEQLGLFPNELNRVGGYSLHSLLHHACQGGHTDLVAQLLDLKADVTVRNIGGVDALMFASRSGFADICTLLLDHGADPNTRTADWTALGWAAYDDSLDVCELLLARGADLDVAMLGGRTALGWYGLGNYDNGPNHPTRPRLSVEAKAQRCETLRKAFANGPLVLQRRRDGNWARRKHFIHFLAGCGFQPLKARFEAEAAANPPLPPNVPIPALEVETIAQQRALLQAGVLAHEGLWKNIAAFM